MLKKSFPLNSKGFATIEMIPIMIIIAILLNFSIGFFGIVHTGILNSIAARNYTFETFRNRTNLLYFHDSRGVGHYRKYNSRAHGIASESRKSDRAIATTRKIGFGMNPEDEGSQEIHEGTATGGGIFGISQGQRNEDIATSPVWIRPMYGICLNTTCSR